MILQRWHRVFREEYYERLWLSMEGVTGLTPQAGHEN
jgi:hypothetical protein